MLLMQFCYTPDDEVSAKQAKDLMDYVHERFPEVSSLLYVVNTKANDTIGDLPVMLHSGTPHIFEVMEDLRFKVGPKSFYQTNTESCGYLRRHGGRYAGDGPARLRYGRQQRRSRL